MTGTSKSRIRSMTMMLGKTHDEILENLALFEVTVELFRIADHWNGAERRRVSFSRYA